MVTAISMLSTINTSARLFRRRRNAIATAVAIAKNASASELAAGTRGREPLIVSVSASLVSRASDSQASMASATFRARLVRLAWGSSVLIGASAETGALGGALGLGPLASPPNETCLCLERGGLAISGDGHAWAAGPTGEATKLGWLPRGRPDERVTGAVPRLSGSPESRVVPVRSGRPCLEAFLR